MDNNTVTVFVGGPIEVPGEQQLISRLRADLEQAGVEATLYANFFTPRPGERQIDLLVDLPWRTAHVEIKRLDQDLPIVGQPNGKWRRLLPDGTEREEGNYGRQTLDETYAITDTMRALARKRIVASAIDFRTTIDAVLCIWPDIPPRSSIEAPKHVTVIGYDELLRRLLQPGSKVPWAIDDWAAFVRHLSLYQPEADTPAEAQRRASLDQIYDFRARARVAFATTSGTRIDVTLQAAAGPVPTEELGHLVEAGSVVVIAGPSGTGKTSAAQDLAVRHCDQGHLVIWARCGEYERGRFGDLLNRSAAPYSAVRRSDLIHAAIDAGAGVTVILDALDGCPEDLRDELIGQLNAFRLRCPAAVLITTNVEVPALEMTSPAVVTTEPPSEDVRREILLAHGSQRPELISTAFTTPYELAIAATCEADLGPDATVPEVHDAYIRRCASSERVRAGLRSIATLLHTQLRSSLDQADVTRHLASAAGGSWSAVQVDEVLDCELLVLERHQVRFRHDLLAQFLAAEAIVHDAPDGIALGVALGAPANARLVNDAIGIERDPRRRWDTIVQLGNSSLLIAALHGGFGTACAQHAVDAIRTLLRRAVDLTRPDLATFQAADLFTSRWLHAHTWSHSEHVILATAGAALADGLLIDEIIPLFDATDALCDLALAEAPLELEARRSTVVGATYGQIGQRDEQGLPATVVSYGCEMRAMSMRFKGPVKGTALRLLEGASPTSYGRLYAAALLSDPRNVDEQGRFGELLTLCWDSGVYHVRLHALQRAEYFWDTPEPARTQILDVLTAITTSHWALSSTIVEALAAFGEVHSEVTVADIRAQVRGLLARPDDLEARKLATTLLTRRYDPEDIVGPYSEAIQTLDRAERARLLLMAVRSGEFSMFLSHDLTDLAGLAPTGNVSLDADITSEFAARAGILEHDPVMPSEGIAAAVAATIGWAKLYQGPLPELPASADQEAEAWHHLMSLLLTLHGGDGHLDLTAVWAGLDGDPAAAVRALACVHEADRTRPWEEAGAIVPRLLAAWPAEFRPIVTWAITNPSAAKSDLVWLGVHPFAIQALGEVGDLSAVGILQPYTLDPELGSSAVDAIRRIHDRHGT